MKIKKISYGRSVKRQISQFEPMETSLLIEAEVEGSNWKADFKELRAKVKKIIDAEDAVLAKLRQASASGRKNTSSYFKEMDEAEKAFSDELDRIS